MKFGEINEYYRELYWEKSINWFDVFKIVFKKKKSVYFLRLGWNVLIIVKIIWGLSKNCKVYDLNNGFFYNIIKFLCLYDLYR